jgi:hypothetical protein
VGLRTGLDTEGRVNIRAEIPDIRFDAEVTDQIGLTIQDDIFRGLIHWIDTIGSAVVGRVEKCSHLTSCFQQVFYVL